jgi:peptide deformylase
MPVRHIYSFADPVLRQKARPVGRIDKATQRLIDDMVETMRAAEGIGLAAPQIGVLERLFVAELDEKVYVFINPQIVSLSQETEVAEEGCLSLPGYRGAVERPTRATVRGKNRRGKVQTVEAEGLLARCFQHEIDHLDGVLFTDRMAPDAVLRPVEQEEPASPVGDRR